VMSKYARLLYPEDDAEGEQHMAESMTSTAWDRR